MSKEHRICCLEIIAYSGELAVGFMCSVCLSIWHLSEYYAIVRGVTRVTEYGPHETIVRGI
jgi:hypothetical protein